MIKPLDGPTTAASIPLGQTNNSISWMQKKVMRQVEELPAHFANLADWKAFRQQMRTELPRVIGMPEFPALSSPEAEIRARLAVGNDVTLERVDVYVDDDYAIPAFVFGPAAPSERRLPALVWNPGWPEDKYKPTYQQFAVRMARQGFIVLIPDHAPFGESAPASEVWVKMTQMMGMGHMLGISQLAMRAAETMRCGEYLRSRSDVRSEARGGFGALPGRDGHMDGRGDG